MTHTQVLSLYGYACGIAAGDQGCADGPVVLQKSNFLAQLEQESIKAHWDAMLHPQSDTALTAVTDLSKRLANLTYQAVQTKKPFTVFGGDHSCAIGTWSGVAAALADKGPMGLIWIDAHMDSHTPESSESGNIHGMPAACLLGHGAPELTQILSAQPKLKPENLCLIGIRSYEPGEADLINRLGVRVYYMDEIHRRGILPIMQEAVSLVTKNTAGYGVTIDLDSMDPDQVPGVGTPEPDGMHAEELFTALSQCVRGDKRLLGTEIAEFNPHHDQNHKTIKIIEQLVLSLY